MSRAKRSPRTRTLQREASRTEAKLVRAKDRLIELGPGGSATHPLDVSTAALIEPKAKAVSCPRCEVPFSLESHEAHSDEHGRLRETKLRCRHCGFARSLWFRIMAPS